MHKALNFSVIVAISIESQIKLPWEFSQTKQEIPFFLRLTEIKNIKCIKDLLRAILFWTQLRKIIES